MDYYRILLVHGFAQSSKNMEYIASSLKKAGFRVDNLNLPLTFSEIEVSERIIKDKITEISRDKFSRGSEIILVGFGLGGVLVRKVVENENLSKFFIKMILIASPTKTPVSMKNIQPLLRILGKLFKPLKIMLKNEIEKIGVPEDVDIGIIRGTEPDTKLFSRFLEDYNDGAFNRDELIFEKEFEVIDIPFGHNELCTRAGTVGYILDFIETGKFIREKR